MTININVLPPGTILENRYRILGLLGQGGMSRVYLAGHTRLNVRVAIKENLQTGHEAQTQFQREAQILARLSHPNLPKVTDHFIEATTGCQYLVMEYVEGEDLEAMIKRTGPLPEATALAWIRQILDALEYLHHQQPPIIHRDVKPGNIKITPEGKAMLVDFGIAKVYDPRQATLTGARAVTPGYAPPEQYGLRTNERSDIYGLGATLYTMLTGRVPPEAPLRMSGEDALAPPSRIVPGKVSPPTEGAVMRAMELETSKRWQSVAQLRVALEGRGVVPRSAPAPAPAGKPTMPLPTKGAPSATMLAAIAMVVIAIGVVLIGSLTVVSLLGRGSSRSGATHMPTYTPKPATVLPTATRPPTPGRGTPTWTATVPTPTRPPASRAVDTIVLALQQEPDTLHPGVGSMMARTIALAPIFVGCMSQNEKTEWIPLGCETVPTIDNGGAKWVGGGADRHLEVTYKIRNDWRWTDGTPVTTKDVLAWWKLNMDPEFEVASRVGIEKIYDFKVVDDKTVIAIWLSNNQAKQAEAGTLKGNVPFEKFVDDYKENGYAATGQPVVDSVYWTYIGWWPAHIVSKTQAKDQAKSDFAKKPTGDGAYVVKEWKAGQELDLVKSDKPFPLGDPKIANIVFRFFGETKAIIAALQKGEIDAVTSVAGLTPADSPDLDKIAAAGVYKVWYYSEYSWEHIDINTTKFPLDDVKVRQALYYAINKKTIIDTLYYGKYTPAELPGAILPTNSQFYTADYTKYPYDQAKAKALLAEAGWDCKALPCTKKVGNEAKKLEIILMTTDRADRQKLAQTIQVMWKAINVGVSLQFLYGRGLFATCSAGGPLYCRTFDAAIYTWVGGDDPGFWGLYNCAGIPTKENNWSGQNNPGWCNKDADTALNAAENNADIIVSVAKRKTAYAPFFNAWTLEVPVIPLFVNAVPIAARTGFKNYTCGPTNAAPCGWNAWQWELTK